MATKFSTLILNSAMRVNPKLNQSKGYLGPDFDLSCRPATQYMAG